MKRDMDLARQILLEIESCEECIGHGWLELNIEGTTLGRPGVGIIVDRGYEVSDGTVRLVEPPHSWQYIDPFGHRMSGMTDPYRWSRASVINDPARSQVATRRVAAFRTTRT
jgi:hypothetical protein